MAKANFEPIGSTEKEEISASNKIIMMIKKAKKHSEKPEPF